MLTYLQIGKLAPNFLTVGVYENRLGRVRLSDYRGKKYVILVFYSANFTSLSIKDLNQLNYFSLKFEKSATQLLAISRDSPFSHLQFLLALRLQKTSTRLKFPLISDLTQDITNKYSVITDDGLCLPSIFIIDKDGIIQYYNVNNILCSRNVNEIFRILKSIQYVKDNPKQTLSLNGNRRNYNSTNNRFYYRPSFRSRVY